MAVHSAALWLSAGNANVLMFDIGTHKYSHIAANILKEKYGDRFTVVFGNSLVTVPKTNVKCDIISVDGDHHFHTAYKDMKNFIPKAKNTTIAFIDDTYCKSGWCSGPNQALKMAHTIYNRTLSYYKSRQIKRVNGLFIQINVTTHRRMLDLISQQTGTPRQMD